MKPVDSPSQTEPYADIWGSFPVGHKEQFCDRLSSQGHRCRLGVLCTWSPGNCLVLFKGKGKATAHKPCLRTQSSELFVRDPGS